MLSVSLCDSRARRNDVIAEELGGVAPVMITQRNEHCLMFTIKKKSGTFLYFDKNQEIGNCLNKVTKGSLAFRSLLAPLIKINQQLWGLFFCF